MTAAGFKVRPATDGDDRAEWIPMLSYSGKLPAPPTTEILPTTALARCGEIPRRAVAAARMAMRDRAVYSEDDVCEVAGEIVARLMAEATPTAARVPMERVQVIRCNDRAEVATMLRWMDGAEANAPTLSETAAVPKDRAEVSRLFGMAANLRRSIDRNRDRDAQTAGETAASERFTPRITYADPETCRTPNGAHEVAMGMLEAIGCRPLRKGDAPIYTLAYSAARASAGLERPEIAEELALAEDTRDRHLSRARAKLRKGGHGPHLWAAALALPDGGTERPIVAKLPASHGTRERPGDVYPNSATRSATGELVPATVPLHKVREIVLDVPHAPRWTRDMDGADWTSSLPAGSRSRLVAQAMRQRERASLKTDATRAADRSTVGLPGTVR